MDSLVLTTLLAFAPPAAPGTVPDPKAQMLQTFGMMAFMLVAMYLLLFRPQQKKAREHANLLKSIKAGDKVVTSGGVIGVIITIKDKTVSLRSADAKFEVLRSAISEVLERSDKPDKSDKSTGTAESKAS